MSFRLVFATGPTPPDPTDARTLGWEEREVGRRIDDDHQAFAVYVHAASVPELVAYVRARGRDCTYQPFAERQALLLVKARL